jgi:acyl-CoA thioester hydrolase
MDDLLPLPRDLRLTRREVFTHWLTERVRWSDTDQVGHVNNLSFGTYVETGRTELLRDLINRNTESRVLLLMAQVNICYLGEVHWPSNVDVGTCILGVSQSSCRMGHGLFVGDHCVGTADTLLVHIDETTRKPSTIEGGLRDFLNEYLIR